MARAVIVGGGTGVPLHFTPRPDDRVLCADGGAAHCLRLGLRPVLLIGDMDSARPDDIAALASSAHCRIVRVPADKNETDTELAVTMAIADGADELVLLGMTGSRLDHFCSALLLLPSRFPPLTKATFLDERQSVIVTATGCLVETSPGDTVSLLPVTPTVKGVCVSGVKWPLTDTDLTWGNSLGVSNRALGEAVRVSHADGILAVFQHRLP